MSVFYLLFSVFFYLLALLSKEMAITLPLIIFVYEWLKSPLNNPLNPPLLRGTTTPLNSPLLKGVRGLLFNPYTLCYIAVTCFYLFIRFYLFKNPEEGIITIWLLSERFMTIPYLILKYLLLLIAPVSLSADYVIAPVKSIISLNFIIP
ncbi:MAG: DUF1736 domain-containing protein, partial [Nitrospinae bacterium]|nr:DUF1736 domain-containing protein [Nitrospinota bacterium]